MEEIQLDVNKTIEEIDNGYKELNKNYTRAIAYARLYLSKGCKTKATKILKEALDKNFTEINIIREGLKQ
jgi:NAD(P)H-nitrite reductase large subunit